MQTIRLITIFGSVFLFLCALFSFIKTPWYLPELFSHYQMQLFIGGAIIFVGLLLLRKSPPVVYILITAALTLNAINLVPYANFERLKIIPQSERIKIEKPGTYSLLQANIFKFNFEYQVLTEMIRDLDPDIFVLFEMTPTWREKLQDLTTIWPHYLALPEDGSHGIGLYSKYPLVDPQIIQMSDMDIPAIISDIRLNGQDVKLVAPHPLPPVSQSFFVNRNQHFQWIEDNMDQFGHMPVIIAGDLNTTMFAPHYKSMMRRTGLHNARRGRGLQNSFYIYGHKPTGIPIDHFLFNDRINVIHSFRTPEIKSDHVPILTYFKVKNDFR